MAEKKEDPRPLKARLVDAMADMVNPTKSKTAATSTTTSPWTRFSRLSDRRSWPTASA